MSIESAKDMCDEVISLPYVAGASLHLEITQNYQGLPFARATAAAITKIFDIAMSSVMGVTITLESGPDVHAVLKLYDRRFGTDLRNDGRKYLPCTVAKKALFESFVRQNAIGPFLTQLAQDQEGRILPIRTHHHLDGTVEGSAKYEAALWQECDGMFNCETKAYELLKDLQGIEIPRLLATVRLVDTSSNISSDLISGPGAKYRDVKGILLQYVPGFNLIDLDKSSVDVKKWPVLVQRAVDVAHKINERGVVVLDCSPRNVIVDEQSQLPVVIDFAQCWFKHEMKIRSALLEPGNKKEKEEEGEIDVDLEAEYWDRVVSTDNPGAIGAVMSTRLKREKGVGIKIQYPDIYGRSLE
ncbi:hypothetical protein V8C35DRAFT_259607 [Trichoderma chlorosporum]